MTTPDKTTPPKPPIVVTSTGEHPAVVLHQPSAAKIVLGFLVDIVAIIGILFLIYADKLTPLEGLPVVVALLGIKVAAVVKGAPPSAGALFSILGILGGTGRRASSFLLLICLVFTAPGCAHLPEVIRALPSMVRLAGGVVELLGQLELVDSRAAQLYAERLPADYAQAAQTLRATLVALEQARLAVDDPNAASVVAAVDAVRAAYVEFRVVCTRLGIIDSQGAVEGVSVVGDTFGGTSGTYVLPQPYLITNRYLE